MPMRRPFAAALLAIAAPLLCALVVESDDGGALHRKPPPRDPGFRHVGLRAATSAVYLGNGWVITAGHAGAGDVELSGVVHRAVPESAVWFGEGKDGRQGSPPDLVAFRIEPQPALAPLLVRPTPPEVGDRVVLIARGCNRGARITWNGVPGWTWGPQTSPRWGTNRVFAAGIAVETPAGRTPAFALRFDAGETRHEAQAALGDSGGAVFIARRGRFELAGILIAIAGQPAQPRDTALYGNFTTAADLSAFAPRLAALLHAR
jgi:hypothetical protein